MIDEYSWSVSYIQVSLSLWNLVEADHMTVVPIVLCQEQLPVYDFNISRI